MSAKPRQTRSRGARESSHSKLVICRKEKFYRVLFCSHLLSATRNEVRMLVSFGWEIRRDLVPNFHCMEAAHLALKCIEEISS